MKKRIIAKLKKYWRKVWAMARKLDDFKITKDQKIGIIPPIGGG